MRPTNTKLYIWHPETGPLAVLVPYGTPYEDVLKAAQATQDAELAKLRGTAPEMTGPRSGRRKS